MFAQVQSPDSLAPEALDAYLEKGWFRMGQTIFTTNFLHFKDQFYSAIWLRIKLDEFITEKKEQKLFRQNACFRTEIRKASINQTKEDLFATYKQGISFEASSSLQQLLFGKSDNNIYDTQEVNVYDGDTLIAVGFFDVGARNAAGITCFYDPGYKKYSLGKYLIYLKIQYCKTLGLQYFYPGYFVPGYSFFDYKLEIGKPALQYLEFATQKWLPINSFSPSLSPLWVMQERLLALQALLVHSNIESKIFYYEFFDATLIPDLRGVALFDFPLFLCFLGSNEDSLNQVIVYDVHDQHYHFIHCNGIWKTNSANSIKEVYSSHVLRSEQDMFSTQEPEELVEIILMAVEYYNTRTDSTKQ